MRRFSNRARRPEGFSLVELLLAMALGLVLVAVIGDALLGEARSSGRLGQLLRERLTTRRALELIGAELQQALSVRRALPPGGHPGCAVSGRRVLLHLVLPEGAVSYLLEPRPDPIWRGPALLRCGPAYALSGDRSNGTVVSRVLVDGLRQEGLILQTAASGLLQVELQRGWTGSAGRELNFDGRIHAAAELEG